MNWLDSRSTISGLLSQAQKSIDKVLDIPQEGDRKAAKESASTSQSASQSSEERSSSSWLSGADSFWGSFTQSVGVNLKDARKKSEENLKEENLKEEKEINQTTKTKREEVVVEKEAKVSSRPQNVKRNSKKKSFNKKRSGEHSDKAESPGTAENDASGTNTLTTQNVKENSAEFKNQGKRDVCNVDTTSFDEVKTIGAGVKLSSKNLFVDDLKHVKNSNKTRTTETVLPNDDGNKQHTEEQDNVTKQGKENGPETEENEKKCDSIEKTDQENETKKFKEDTGHQDKGKVVEIVPQHNEDKELRKEKDLILIESDEQKIIDVNGFETLVDSDSNNENPLNREYKEHQSPEEKILESFQDIQTLSSSPVATSTPCLPQAKARSKCISDNNNPINDASLKPSNILGNEYSENVWLTVEDKRDKDFSTTHSGEILNVLDDNTIQECSKLRQVIEVRESKLVELSKENLNLQETNAVLRSQIEQLEGMHKSEDAELEQMKEEFTKRIGESDAKLQVAAKERDLFKKQLEETQKCLSSDLEKQLRDFQSLLQQKDEQIAQLMEEGKKLSKDILQRNNTIKKMRVQEKDSNNQNQTLKARLEEAESEIERLTKILKERDDYKKEQDDAIKKLNTYIKKQEEMVAKQKTELEESAAKLPSLQTALDNAYKEITELHKQNAAKSNEVQEAALSVEMTAKEELRIAMEKLKKESQKECDVLAMEVTDLQTQLSRSEQQAARREDILRQEIADIQMRLQEAESRNQELTESVSVATKPLLRQIENLQHSYGSQQASWEKLERTLTERLAEAQNQLASAQEKERAATERSMEASSRLTSLESQVRNYRQEKSRIEAEFELEKAKVENLEDFKSRETGKIEALKSMHSKQLETLMMEKSLLEQQLVVEKTKYESGQKRLKELEQNLREKPDLVYSGEHTEATSENESSGHVQADRRHSRTSSTSSMLSLSDNLAKGLPSGGTAVLEELRATIRHKEGELDSLQSVVSTLESSRESLTEELTLLMTANENLVKENKQLHNMGKSFQELQTKYNALLQMYGEKQEETEELKLDLQDIKNMYKAQIQELLSER